MGTGVAVHVGVADGVAVGIGVSVRVGVADGVAVGVAVAVRVRVAVLVGRTTTALACVGCSDAGHCLKKGAKDRSQVLT